MNGVSLAIPRVSFCVTGRGHLEDGNKNRWNRMSTPKYWARKARRERERERENTRYF